MGRRLGIIVGINSYQDAAFRPLQYAENDARALAQWLVNTKGGNWAPADVQHVQGAYATHELIESLIIQMCVNVAGPGDLIFVYFAGHAFLDERSGDGYLALANTQYQQPGSGLHLPSLAQCAMGQSRAAHVVFMLDCFQTGRIWNMRRSSSFDASPLLGPVLLSALQQTGDRLIYCSCRGNDMASESGEKNLGLFAYRMLLGLCGPAIDAVTKQVTLQRLHAFLFNALGEQHRPQLFGQERATLTLVGDMPSLFSSRVSGPLPPQYEQQPQNSPLSPQQNGNTAAAFAPGLTQSSTAQPATTGSLMNQAAYQSAATAQLSPTTSGLLSPSPTEQQSTMLLRQAHHLVQMQNPSEAYNIIEQALRIAPTNIPALILKAQLLGTAGRFDEALSTIEQALHLDPDNALAWSVQAALLTNTGQYQQALQAIERSLEIEPNNPETYSIKTSVMGHIASFQPKTDSKMLAAVNRRKATTSFFIGTGIQFLGLIVGIAGAALLLIQPKVPTMLAFLLESLGLALLCINAARGSYMHGFTRFLLTLFTSIIAAGLLGVGVLVGGVNKIGSGRVYVMIQNNPNLLVPILFLGLWLAAAAALPLLLAFFALIGGFIVRATRKKR